MEIGERCPFCGGVLEEVVSREMVSRGRRVAYFWLLSGSKRIFDGP